MDYREYLFQTEYNYKVILTPQNIVIVGIKYKNEYYYFELRLEHLQNPREIYNKFCDELRNRDGNSLRYSSINGNLNMLSLTNIGIQIPDVYLTRCTLEEYAALSNYAIFAVANHFESIINNTTNVDDDKIKSVLQKFKSIWDSMPTKKPKKIQRLTQNP